jgi:hypothetical protein
MEEDSDTPIEEPLNLRGPMETRYDQAWTNCIMLVYQDLDAIIQEQGWPFLNQPEALANLQRLLATPH